MAWKPGKKLKGDRYVIERTLGLGRSAITYLAYDRKVKNRLVIKTLSDEVLLQLQQDTNAIVKLQDKLFQEAKKLSDCKHRHVVRCLGDPFREREGNQERVCIPMEYIAGVDLASLTQKPLSETDALHYIRQIGEALICVHSQGLLHRDLKPENVLVRHGTKDAVLIDFDLARETDTPLSSRRDISDGFAPLELSLTSLPLDARSDVYSLTATLYYLVTGETPPSAEQRQVNPSQNSLVEPKNLNSNLSDRINQAILQGMALEPGARPDSMEAWLEQLGSGRGEVEPQLDLEIDWTRYGKLRDLLAAGEWREADQETGRVMLAVANREEEGWLNVKDIDKFPCEDLKAIDHLWVKYSNGRFGFSVQKRIYQELGGTRKYKEAVWEAFGDRVGWRKEGIWLSYNHINFSTKALPGHLPLRGKRWVFSGIWLRKCVSVSVELSLLSR